ncbi:hypothetical protein ZHAS_00018729 [Anopheles sinensis]|uniref:Ig-like domain-containing protein n=1 Tax=Anopheles sinensis TaxID=74873 RepID=A0A084WKE6_ANOSI|nr:hypothetical protein ZHAS_00018729 [Anopheles sinensis]
MTSRNRNLFFVSTTTTKRRYCPSFCPLFEQNQISWIRRRDWHILSSGAQMYTNDERFAILHTPGSNTWTLQIKFVQRRDHGTYECQFSPGRRKNKLSTTCWCTDIHQLPSAPLTSRSVLIV